ncbi:head completion/stabilization protein [Novosphingobium sp.]|uniref:head completion/stabilization protein n=1 Tax=Novosphingobium sp. TaxID=1874826 RepID=UPI0031DFB561
MTTSSPIIFKPAPPASAPGAVFPGDGWWPDIDLAAMRAAMRVGEVVTDPRLIFALESAAVKVGDDLANWRAARERQGCASLAEVAPNQKVNGKPRLVSLYIGAMRYAALAELTASATDVTATATDETRQDAKLDTGCYLESLRLQNVRAIMGFTRVAVELI